MSKKRSETESATPEFRLIVTRPNGRGPIGPYRLALAVAFAMVIGGGRLWSTLRDGAADDAALLAAAAAGVFVWIVLTVIDNILGSVAKPGPTPAAADHVDGDHPVAAR